MSEFESHDIHFHSHNFSWNRNIIKISQDRKRLPLQILSHFKWGQYSSFFSSECWSTQYRFVNNQLTQFWVFSLSPRIQFILRFEVFFYNLGFFINWVSIQFEFVLKYFFLLFSVSIIQLCNILSFMTICVLS